VINAGELNQRITIEEPTTTQDSDTGEPSRSWSTLSGAASLPVKVESVSGGETVRGRQVHAEATTLFTARYLSTVTTLMRVTYESRALHIVRVSDPYGDRRELRIECKE